MWPLRNRTTPKKIVFIASLLIFITSSYCDAFEENVNNTASNSTTPDSTASNSITPDSNASSSTTSNTFSLSQCPMYLRPRDCEEVLQNGHRTSGVYTIYPKKPLRCCESVQVYCDMDTDGGGWIVIQRRGNNRTPSDFFNQEWHTYKKGFGDLTREFWLGNEYLHAISGAGTYSARMDMRNYKGEERYAFYNTFGIEHEENNYKLIIADYIWGSAGDAISNHNGRDFYTKDKPNIPRNSKNSRQVPNSGWWYNVYPSSNLNGLKVTSGEDGIVWSTFGGYSPPLVFSEIKLRPRR